MNRRLLFLLVGLSLVSFVQGQLPVAGFTSTTGTSGCAPLLVTFQDQSTNNPTSWKWDFGDGSASFPQQNPPHVYSTPGVYSVTLTATNAAGSSAPYTKTAYITVYPTPKADFSSNAVTGCFPLKVQFTDNSTDPTPIVAWNWDFGDGTTGTGQNPQHIYTSATPAAGIPVTLQVIDKNGCSGQSGAITKSNYIKIPYGINADFSSTSNSSGCNAAIPVNFNNLTSGGAPGITYSWSFGDGQTSTQTSPVNNYATTGSYKVLLTATSAGSGGISGCQDTVSHIVQLSGSNTQSNFTAPASVCVGSAVVFQNTSSPSPDSSVWDFGDGTGSTDYSAVKTYTVPGTYPVTLKNTFGACKGVVTKNITVNPFPVANFTADDSTSCQSSLTVNFKDLSTNATSWQWSFGDRAVTSTFQNPSHTYGAYAQYTVTLTVSNSVGCSNTVTKTNYVVLAVPSITLPNLPANGCTPYAFTPAVSYQGADSVAAYSWNLGNGTSSNQAAPTVTYTVPGVYTVTLAITTKTGCTASASGIVTTGSSKPKAAFTASAYLVCPTTPVIFTDNSTGNPPPDNWLWDFGNGSTSTSQDPTQSYSGPGNYRVRLQVFSHGCYDTTSAVITVKPPLAAFTDSCLCNNRSQYLFNDSASQAQTWSWNFGDGTPVSTNAPPLTHVFPATGPYTVKLLVTNGACSASTQKIVNVVSEKANFTATPDVACRNAIVFLYPTGSNPANITSYLWNFGDGSPSGPGASNGLYHIFTQAGTYNTSLTITETNGCKDSITKPMQVNGPVAGFTVNNVKGCKGLTVTITDQTVPDGTHALVHWTWDYGDGTVVDYTTPPFVHTYTTQGIFSIKEIVTDASGCVDSLTKYDLITVNVPRALFSSVDSMSCPGSTVLFGNTSTGSGLQYNWVFGDGSPNSTDPAPGHAYNNVGFYTVKLSILDQYGCRDSMIKSNYVRIDTPNASFMLNDSISSCPPMKGVFTFMGHYAQTTNWLFGDGANSPLASPIHNYNIPGNFTAILTVTSPGGCTAQDSAHIKIFGPYGTLSYSPVAGCNPLTVNFTVATQGTLQYYWDFGDSVNNQPNVNAPTNTYTYASDGSFLPFVYLVDSVGCTVPVYGSTSILVVGDTAKFVYDRNVLCDSGYVQFTDSSRTNGTITLRLWDFGDGSTSTLQNPSHYYAGPGFYTVKLVITTQYGCSDTYVLPNIIKVVNSPVVDIKGANPACVPASLRFSGVVLKADTSALVWNWNLFNGSIAQGQNLFPHSYAAAGQDSVELIVTNSSGCKDTVNKKFTIYPLPPVNAGMDTAICLGQSIGLLASGAPVYNWLPPKTTLSCTTCANPVADPTVTTSYIVQGTSNFGCLANDTVQVRVIQPTTLTVDPLDSICKGQQIKLVATGADVYNWSPSTGLSDPSAAAPIASPDTTTLYTLTGGDYKSCFSDTKTIQVTVFNYPTITLGPDTVTLPVGSTFAINGVGSPDITSITWAPVTGLSCSDCLAPVAKPVNTTTYFVKVTNNGGCSVEDKITFIVTCNNQNFFVPNTFSPNGDGANDYFYIRGKGLNTVHSLQIFNRWGQKIFERRDFPPNDQSYGWDGTVNGQKAPMDTYVYLLEIVCDNSTIIPYHGNVTLIR
ncbi:MAG: PKD domain-containing protein [Puia sp.]|nr:PKD domain-containing protein [Puia sp.]